ncbi:Cysteine-rich receptor-like protein kinase 4 [Linum perenne]
MLNNSSNRKSFIQTTIQTARRHGFGGMDFSWSKDSPNDLANIGTLFKEWRAGINSEVRTAGERKLLLTAALDYAPGMGVRNFPVGSIRKHLDWVHVMAQNLESSEVMEPDAPLNDPEFLSATRSGIDAWISVGKVDPGKLVLSLPLYGFAWKLANPEEENYIGARVKGGGFLSYGQIKEISNGTKIMYNSTYAVNYCTVNGSVSVIFDGPEAIRAKVSYTTEMELGGYYVWQIPYDYNGELALLAAQEQSKKQRQLKRREGVLAGTISVAAFLTIILSIAAFYWIRINGLGIFKGMINIYQMLLLRGSVSSLRVEDIEGSGDFGKNDTVPNLRVYSFEEINKATNRFSLQNKLGRGGYGPVYKGVLPDGQEIAVKKLSETSTQGLHEFKNEVQLNARIQHVNLVRVLGYCIDNDEKMLIYEFMPNNSLDKYLYDSAKRNILDWSRRVEIIQGITQGLVYLQEYSRLPIIHRDLKASNILLDSDFLPKISDFGIAKVFSKNGQETNTVRIVGTIGYTPPEYFSQGTYSVKSDVYGFGVLLLQIITSKKVARIYGPAGDSSLQEYAFELWEDGRGMEIVEPSLDDTSSSCKLLTCLRIALLCVQDDPIDRPSMLQVASMLRNETVVGSLFPKRPTFSFRKQQQQQQGDNNNITEPAVFQPEFCSIADATITQLDGR